MIALLIQSIMGFGFGWLIASDPEELIWKKIGVACALQGIFLTGSLQASGAGVLERMALIILLIIPFLWGVTEGVKRCVVEKRKNKR